MKKLFPIQQVEGVDCVDSRLIAEDLGVHHSSFVKILKKYQSKIEPKFGRVGFEIVPLETKGGIQNKTIAYLNEGQAIAAATLSRNTERVVDVKLKLTDSFLKAKALLRTPPEQKAVPTTLELAKELVKVLEEREQDKPKVEYFEKVLTAQNSFPVTFIAKELGMSARKLNKHLKEYKIQYKLNGTWILYSDYQNKGYTDTYTYAYENSEQEVFLSKCYNGQKKVDNLYTIYFLTIKSLPMPNRNKPKKVRLKKVLKQYDLIDIVDALDCLMMCYRNTEIKVLSDQVKGYHLDIARRLRNDIYKSTQ